MRLTPAEQDAERAHEEHVAAKLANFGDRAGCHGPLAAVTVKLPPVRVDRETNLRLVNLSRALGFKGRTTPIRLIMLQAMSQLPAGSFYQTIAEIQRRGA